MLLLPVWFLMGWFGQVTKTKIVLFGVLTPFALDALTVTLRPGYARSPYLGDILATSTVAVFLIILDGAIYTKIGGWVSGRRERKKQELVPVDRWSQGSARPEFAVITSPPPAPPPSPAPPPPASTIHPVFDRRDQFIKGHTLEKVNKNTYDAKATIQTTTDYHQTETAVNRLIPDEDKKVNKTPEFIDQALGGLRRRMLENLDQDPELPQQKVPQVGQLPSFRDVIDATQVETRTVIEVEAWKMDADDLFKSSE